MVYIFSSAPKTICSYMEQKRVMYTLISKEDLKAFSESYVPNSMDWGLVYDFGKFISKTLLEKLFMVNIHFSLLPKYRGATPVEAAILSGDTDTGITVQKMVSEMDAGAIISTYPIPIESSWTSGELQSYMDSKLPYLLEQLLAKHPRECGTKEQIGEPSFCYESMLEREKAQLKFLECSSTEIIQKIKAYNPEPIAWFAAHKQGKEVTVNVFRAEHASYSGLAPGQYLFVKKQGLLIGCLDTAILITELVVSGSKRLIGGDIVSLKGLLTVKS